MTSAVYVLDGYRFKSDFGILNGDIGWVASENATATLDLGTRYRLRIHFRETAGKGSSEAFEFWVLHPQGYNTWQRVVMDNDAGGTVAPIIPRPSFNYSDGAACSTELLTNQGGTFDSSGGTADTVDGAATADPDDTEEEVELCFTPVDWYYVNSTLYQVDDGDTLQVQLRRAGGTTFGTYTNTPTITINVPNKYIGGVYAETFQKVGPFFDTNGNMYICVETAEPWPELRMVKSTDDGVTWTEVDSANRPANRDIESMDVVQVGSVLHMGHYASSDVAYYTFNTSDAGSNPDTWQIEQDVSTSTTTDLQCVGIAPLSTGEIFMGYQRNDGTYESVYYRVRSTGGTWGSETEIDTAASTNFYGPIVVREVGSDKVHIFYKDQSNGDIYHTSWTSGGGLTSRELVEGNAGTATANELSMTNAVAWQSGTDEMIMIVVQDDTNDYLYSVTITNDGSPETRRQVTSVANHFDGGSSRKPTAALAVDGTDIYCVFVDATSLDIWYTLSQDDDTWDTPTEIQDGSDITTYAVCCNVGTHSSKVLAYYWDESDGYTGEVFYDEVSISTGTEYNQSAAGTLTPSGTVSGKALKALAGALTSAGVLIKSTATSLDGTLTSAGAVVKQAAASLAGTLSSSGDVSTVRMVMQAVAGTLTSAGNLVKLTSVSYDGALTSAGTLVGQGQKALAGALTSAGALTKQAATSLAGTLTSAGDVVTVKTVLYSLAGTLTTAGVLAKQTALSYAGTLATTGDVFKQSAASLSGTLTTSGVVDGIKIAVQALAGTLTTAGDVTAQAGKALAGTLATAGDVTGRVGKALAGTLTSAGTLTARAAKALAGTLTTSGYLDAALQAAGEYYQSVAGTLTTAGALTKQAQTSLAGTLATAGDVIKEAATSLAGTLTTSGIVSTTKVFTRALAGTLTTAGDVTARAGKALAGALTTSGTLVKTTLVTFTGNLATAGTLIKDMAVALTGTLASSGVLATARVAVQALAGTLDLAGDITRQAAKSLVGGLTSGGTLAARVGKALAGSLAPTGIITTTASFLRSFAGTLSSSGIVYTIKNAVSETVDLTLRTRSVALSLAARSYAATARVRSFILTLRDRE